MLQATADVAGEKSWKWRIASNGNATKARMIALFDSKWHHLGHRYGGCPTKCPSFDCFAGFPSREPNSTTCVRARSP